MTDHGQLAEQYEATMRERNRTLDLLTAQEQDAHLTRRDAMLGKHEDELLGVERAESEPKTLDVRSGTVIAAIHCCDHPDVLVGREELITRPVIWRCDCGAYWHLESEKEWHTPIFGITARAIYKRSWVRETDRFTLMWYALRRLFRK